MIVITPGCRFMSCAIFSGSVYGGNIVAARNRAINPPYSNGQLLPTRTSGGDVAMRDASHAEYAPLGRQ